MSIPSGSKFHLACGSNDTSASGNAFGKNCVRMSERISPLESTMTLWALPPFHGNPIPGNLTQKASSWAPRIRHRTFSTFVAKTKPERSANPHTTRRPNHDCFQMNLQNHVGDENSSHDRMLPDMHNNIMPQERQATRPRSSRSLHRLVDLAPVDIPAPAWTNPTLHHSTRRRRSMASSTLARELKAEMRM